MWIYLLLVASTVWCVVRAKQCAYGDVLYQPGTVNLEPCVTCWCSGDTGQLTCSHKVCPPRNDPACIRYEVPPGACCPVCVEFGCLFKGRSYRRGEKLALGQCSYCYCPWQGVASLSGNVICLNMTCADVHCARPITPPGRCCPVCPQS
ncbi:hypothetical protein LSH36_67g01029 [Paralvinella palmiformis]|uniref:VWFC domain-containing protein n=1 Tax=Paralvinella palmiformis TaxID=53620 RepID=A0AAD9K3F4_9ANNE|nr:hypothetical protein LSH36_67g01029 [Paralvinella palmiformis]